MISLVLDNCNKLTLLFRFSVMPDISNKTELLVLIKAMIEFVDKYFTSNDEALQEFHGKLQV